jgi:cytochrome c peroxidase
MLADANGTFTRAIGLSVDLPDFGLSGRSERCSMVVQDGMVKAINVEKTVFDHGVSSAATCMLHT